LERLKVEEERWNKWSLDDVSLAEVARYLRDRYLDAWREHPTAAAAETTLDTLRRLFAGLGSADNRDLPLLLRGAENYLSTKLAEATVEPPEAKLQLVA